MTLKEIQEEIIANRQRRGFPSAHDLQKTTLGLREELGEWERALEKGDEAEMVDALADLMVFCLGAFQILGRDAHTEVEAVVERNRTRSHRKVH